MKIRYGALALRPQGGGVTTYAVEFLREASYQLADHELSALVQRDARPMLPSDVRAVTRPVVAGAVRAAFAAAPIRHVDLVHSLDVDLPLATTARTVATVHDLSVFDTPWAYSQGRARGERILLRRSLRAADRVISVSEFTAERLHARLGVDSVVVPLAPPAWAHPPAPEEVTAVQARYGLPENFVLQVGTVEPRKSIHLLAEAAIRLDVPLVLAGAGSRGPTAPSRATGLGFVDVAELPALYAAATVVAYASRYEGFGLPPIEAMACGGAVVASRCGALPQVVGDGAVLVSTPDVESWVAALRPVLADIGTREGLRVRGIAVAAGMSWADNVRTTFAEYG